jgi:hypothetical protein
MSIGRSDDKKCAICDYFDGEDRCKEDSPKIYIIGDAPVTLFPKTSENGCCGKFCFPSTIGLERLVNKLRRDRTNRLTKIKSMEVDILDSQEKERYNTLEVEMLYIESLLEFIFDVDPIEGDNK